MKTDKLYKTLSDPLTLLYASYIVFNIFECIEVYRNGVFSELDYGGGVGLLVSTFSVYLKLHTGKPNGSE